MRSLDPSLGISEEVTEVALHPEVSPGGTFITSRDGSRLGVWVHEGDRLLFDVVLDVVDRSVNATPTSLSEPKAIGADEENAPQDAVVTKSSKPPRIRFLSPTLAGRAEGVVNVVRDNFGFVHLADRNVDAYFRLYDVFPPELQSDLTPGWVAPLRVTIGAEVSFDLSLQSLQGGRGPVPGGGRGAKAEKGQVGGNERENLVGHRISYLPPGTIAQSVTLAEGVSATVCKEDEKHPFVGNIELEATVKGMTMEQRHPMLVRMLNSILVGPVDGGTVYPHMMSEKENQIVRDMVDAREGLQWEFLGSGRLKITRVNSDAKKEESTATETANVVSEKIPEVGLGVETSAAETPTRKGRDRRRGGGAGGAAKVKQIRTVRFDRHSLPPDELHDSPGLGDVVTCDIVQSRRTGAVSVVNLKVVERKKIQRGRAFSVASDQHVGAAMQVDEDMPSEGIGLVAELVVPRQFGFISLMDEGATKRDQLFFHMSSIVQDASAEAAESGEHKGEDGALAESTTPNRGKKGRNNGGVLIRKGDEVTFNIGTGKNGKRLALNVRVLPHGTLNIPTKTSKDACQGYILMEPSYTSLANTPSRKPLFAAGAMTSPVKVAGRWENVSREEDKRDLMSSNIKEQGYVLLLSDPSGMFSASARGGRKRRDSISTSSEDVEESEKAETTADPVLAEDNTMIMAGASAVGTSVTYTNGAVAMRGDGSASLLGDASSAPKRGDLVSFVRVKGGKGTTTTTKGTMLAVRDVRVVKRGSATAMRGQLVDIKIVERTATFRVTTGRKLKYSLDLNQVVSCEPSLLKEGEQVEGIVHEGKVYGGGYCCCGNRRANAFVQSRNYIVLQFCIAEFVAPPSFLYLTSHPQNIFRH